MKIDLTTQEGILHITAENTILVRFGPQVYYVTRPERLVTKEVLWSGGRKVTVFSRVIEGVAYRTQPTDEPPQPLDIIIVLARWIWRGLVETIKGVISKITPLKALLQLRLGDYKFAVGVSFAAA